MEMHASLKEHSDPRAAHDVADMTARLRSAPGARDRSLVLLPRVAKSMRPSSLRRSFATIASTCELRGTSLHSGATSRVRLHPSEDGIRFVRPGAQPIEAHVDSVVSTTLCTTLGDGTSSVSTVEHLMAALCGLGVDSCTVEVDASELPVLDGSAAPWVDAVRAAGLSDTQDNDDSPPAGLRLTCPVRVEEGDSWAVALPAASPRLTVGIDFPSHAAIGRQWATWSPAVGGSDVAEDFASSIAPARTFTLVEHIDAMRAQGLVQGGSLDNALVCDLREGWLNESGLRFTNEPARHKLLDLIGDLALLPGHTLPNCHVVAFRAGHRLHVALGRALLAAAAATKDATHEADA